MDVTLYRNFSQPNKLNKNLSQVAKYTGVQVVNETDDFDVSIRMTVTTGTLKWDNVNYFEWDGAYYYLESVTKTANSISTVKDTFDFQNPDDPDPVKINQSGVIGHLFAKRRVQIEDLGEHMESMRDPVGLKTNYFTHLSGRVVVDDYENAVTFLAADPVTP